MFTATSRRTLASTCGVISSRLQRAVRAVILDELRAARRVDRHEVGPHRARRRRRRSRSGRSLPSRALAVVVLLHANRLRGRRSRPPRRERAARRVEGRDACRRRRRARRATRSSDRCACRSACSAPPSCTRQATRRWTRTSTEATTARQERLGDSCHGPWKSDAPPLTTANRAIGSDARVTSASAQASAPRRSRPRAKGASASRAAAPRARTALTPAPTRPRRREEERAVERVADREHVAAEEAERTDVMGHLERVRCDLEDRRRDGRREREERDDAGRGDARLRR